MELVDFYRGTLSARLLGVYVRQLSAKSALVRALNDGQPPWTITDHLVADVWSVWTKQDHPVRAEMEAKKRIAAKQAKVIRLNEKRKRTYGLE